MALIARRTRCSVTLAAALLGCGAEGTEPPDFDRPPAVALVRPDTPGNKLLFHFEPDDVVETHGSDGGSFLVHFTHEGPNAVPPADTDQSGVPDFVEDVAQTHEKVLATYGDGLDFRAPLSDEAIADNGGDGRFDVYLVDFAGKGDGNYQNDACGKDNPQQCAGYMVQENDYKGYGYPSTTLANRILASHEFFHAVQAAYDTEQGSVMAEGTAVWATEQFDPSLPDFEYFIDGYLQNPDRSLDQPMPGPVDPFSYGTALFFEFLEERYGAGTVRRLWEKCENGAGGIDDPRWFEQLGPVLGEVADTSFADAFVEFATYNLFTGAYADPSRSYKNGAAYGPVKKEKVAAPFVDDKLRVFYASSQYYRLAPEGRSEMSAALVSADPAQLDGLALLLAVLRGKSYDAVVRVSDPAAGSEAVDTAGADALVAVVVSGRQEGDSRRPGLCIGAPAEVESCQEGLLGTGGAGGAGGGDGVGAGGEGGSSGAPPPGVEPEEEAGCGCRWAGGPPAGAAGIGLVVAFLAALGRRRRGRAATAPAGGVPSP
ncbi:MAG: hypothetical protein HY744_31755 [Deltaproteobacteria bacterium]|nr:hypothetical protein [Deltaproteobacteria bacterium]